jgi:hypothetical protein
MLCELIVRPMTKVLHVAGALAAGGGACVLLTASAAQDRTGLHVFIIADRVTGQVFVDKRVEGPFRGTSSAARSERQRLGTQVARNAEVVRDQVSTFDPGKCILIYQTSGSTLFTDVILPSADMDRRIRSLRTSKNPPSIKFDKQCL